MQPRNNQARSNIVCGNIRDGGGVIQSFGEEDGTKATDVNRKVGCLLLPSSCIIRSIFIIINYSLY